MSTERMEEWFSDQLNGDWEHQGGINITTLDNPGWLIEVDLDTIAGDGYREISSFAEKDSELDFVKFYYDESENRIRVICGVRNLSQALSILFERVLNK
ncbi:Imm53 family immunity protein [Roseibium sp.]|uniref:Imm53 family immunity protein n=1 Tax=Roseibium sp. TaxID=1936156 RepID=UPI003B51C91B